MIVHGNCLDVVQQLGDLGAVITDPPIKVSQSDGERYHLHNSGWLPLMRKIAPVVIILASPEVVASWPTPSRVVVWNHVDNTSSILVYGEAHLPDIITHPWPDRDAFGHYSVKPLGLMLELVRGTSGKVLDPFCGTGTTGVACRILDREFVGFEIDRQFAETARKRIAEAHIAA